MDFAVMRSWVLSVRAVVSDGKGVAMRLLCDIERFGFDLIEFRLSLSGDGSAVVRFAVAANGELDRRQMQARFERHPAVFSIRVSEKKSRGASQ
jgi:hypothetical protein